MFRKGVLLFVCLLVSVGFAVAAQAANRVIYVLVDSTANRAYVPEGTVLPDGLTIRARQLFAADGDSILDRSLRGKMLFGAKREHLLRTPPLVFEYAPAAKFETMRAQYEAKHAGAGPGPHKAQPASDYCYDVYASQDNTGLYGTYTDGITSTFCGWNNTVVGYSYSWSFTVTGDWSDVDNRIGPGVGINDANSNFYCYDPYSYQGDTGQCTATATTVWTNTACTNHVHAWGLLYKIEYTNDPYVDNYLGFELDIDNCTTFY